MEQKYLSKREAAYALGISPRTLDRKMAAGEIVPAAKDADGAKHGRVWFTRECLGLPQQASCKESLQQPEQASATNLVAHPEPLGDSPKRPLTSAEQRIADDLQFADQYLKGEVTDSFGSSVGETKHSALGPNPPVESSRADSTAHMNPALLGTHKVTAGTDGLPVEHAGSANNPLLAGFKGVETRQRSPHPNAIRQMILADVLRGWSR